MYYIWGNHQKIHLETEDLPYMHQIIQWFILNKNYKCKIQSQFADGSEDSFENWKCKWKSKMKRFQKMHFFLRNDSLYVAIYNKRTTDSFEN